MFRSENKEVDSMKTAKQLFYRRLRSNWQFQLQTLKMAVDWTVAVYIVVPALLLAGGTYRSWWIEPPEWFAIVPAEALFVLMFLFSVNMTVRLFVEEADQLFLLQRRRWIRGVVGRALAYTFAVQTAAIGIVLALLTPMVLKGGHLNAGEWAAWCGLTVLFRPALSLMLHLISRRLSRIKRIVSLAIGVVAAAVVYFSAAGAVQKGQIVYLVPLAVALLLLLTALVRRRLSVSDTFLQDVEAETKAKMRLAQVILSQVLPKPPKLRRHRPFLFRNSGRLFRKRTAEYGLAEAGLKSFWRSAAHMRLYIQFVSLGSAAVWLVPDWIKALVWLLILVPLGLWLRNFWLETLESPFVRLFSWRNQDVTKAAERTLFWLLWPPALLTGFAAGASGWSWLGALLAIPLSIGIAYLAAQWAAVFSRPAHFHSRN
jgi:ABC-2 type transport system permease protein